MGGGCDRDHRCRDLSNLAQVEVPSSSTVKLLSSTGVFPSLSQFCTFKYLYIYIYIGVVSLRCIF